jgi:hypothetical protein
MNQSIYSLQKKQELIDHYETLRSEVLHKEKTSIHGNLGYSILLLRGMTAWIKTHLSLEFIYSDPFISVQLEEIKNCTEQESILFPPAIQEEATMILANMILSH